MEVRVAVPWRREFSSMSSAIIKRTSDLSLEEVCARLPAAAAKHQFGLLGTHDLKEKMRNKGLSFERECRVFEVCDPRQAHAILSGDIAVSAALPCRISVYDEGGSTLLATIAPEGLLRLFDPPSSDAQRIARQVETDLIAIMDEAAGVPTESRAE